MALQSLNDKDEPNNYAQPKYGNIKKTPVANYNSNSEVNLKRKDQLANAYLPKLGGPQNQIEGQ